MTLSRCTWCCSSQLRGGGVQWEVEGIMGEGVVWGVVSSGRCSGRVGGDVWDAIRLEVAVQGFAEHLHHMY